MELVKLNHPLPVKAYPDAELNKIILTEFMPWIARLLSLTGETSAERLEIALPAIKEHCWSMGFSEIKKMFEMYSDNKLNIDPMPNYFDRILFGKIVSSYKQQLPTRKPIIEKKEVSEEEKELIIYTGIITCFDSYKQRGRIDVGYGWLYVHFYELDKFPTHSIQFREKVRERALKSLKLNPPTKGLIATVKNYSESAISQRAKELILGDYFDKLIKSNKHIKTEIESNK